MVNTAPKSTELTRLFLQTVLSRRVVPEEILLQLYRRCIKVCQTADEEFQPPHPQDENGLRAFTRDLNTILEDQTLEMQFRTCKDEGNHGEEVWALVNTDPNDEATMMTDYEPLQIAFIRTVVNSIVESYPANSLGSNAALSCLSALESKITRSQAEALLRSLVSRRWLDISKRGRYSLAPRSILELDGWLKLQHEDLIKACGRCGHTVFTGIICSNRQCNHHFHTSCYKLLKLPKDPKCPKCEVKFADAEPKALGEKAVPRAEDSYTQIRGKRKRPSTQSRRRGQDDEDEDEDEDELEEEEGQDMASANSSRQRASRDSGGDGRGGGRGRKDGDETTEEEDEGEASENRDTSSGVSAQTGGPSTWKVAGRSRKSVSAVPEDDDEEEEIQPRRKR